MFWLAFNCIHFELPLLLIYFPIWIGKNHISLSIGKINSHEYFIIINRGITCAYPRLLPQYLFWEQNTRLVIDIHSLSVQPMRGKHKIISINLVDQLSLVPIFVNRHSPCNRAYHFHFCNIWQVIGKSFRDKGQWHLLYLLDFHILYEEPDQFCVVPYQRVLLLLDRFQGFALLFDRSLDEKLDFVHSQSYLA